MVRNDFSDIRNFAELETSIRMIRRQIATNNVSQKVSSFKANGGPTWADVVLLITGALRKRLLK